MYNPVHILEEHGMYVHIESGQARLMGADDTRSLKVVITPGTTRVEAAQILAHSGFGRFDESYAWLSIANLQSQSRFATTPANFAAMVTYADAAGWVNGDDVRAHIEEASHA